MSSHKSQIKYVLFLDVETSGLDPEKNEILQLAATMTDSKFNELGTFDSFVKPQKSEMSAEALSINKIDIVKLKDESTIVTVIAKFIKFCNENIGKDDTLSDIMVAGQNVKFDIAFLNVVFKDFGFKQHPFNYHSLSIDNIYTFYRFILTGKFPKSVSLNEMCKVFNLETKGLHNARNDINVSIIILKRMISDLQDLIGRQYEDL